LIELYLNCYFRVTGKKAGTEFLWTKELNELFGGDIKSLHLVTQTEFQVGRAISIRTLQRLVNQLHTNSIDRDKTAIIDASNLNIRPYQRFLENIHQRYKQFSEQREQLLIEWQEAGFPTET
ncbi:MAG: hypothetical protein ACMG6E_07070, partial [Candidatus Roizmanbacteria bacterium]